MVQQMLDNAIFDAVALLKYNGFDVLAEAVTVLLNTAMLTERSEFLGARPYERTEERRGDASGLKDRTVKTRLEELPLRVPQTRGSEFYPPNGGFTAHTSMG